MPPKPDNAAASGGDRARGDYWPATASRDWTLPWRQTFAALRHRNFRLFFFGQLISLIGTWMQNTAQSWPVYQLTGSKLLLGIVAAVGSAPMLFFSLWGGSVADRHPKRVVLLWTQSGMMVLAFVFAALVWSKLVQPWHILVLSALGGVAMAFDMPARQAFMVEMSSREDLMNALSLNSSIVNGARVAGPAVAGILIASAGLTACFVLNGLSFLAVLAGLLMMRLPTFMPPARPESNWQHALEGFDTWPGTAGSTLLLLFGIVGVFGWSYSVLMPAFASDVLRVGSREYGMLLSANGIGALCGALTVATYGDRLPGACWCSAAWGSSADAAVVGRDPELLPGAGLYGDLRLGHAALLLHYQYRDPAERRRRHAWPGDGHLGAGIRRHVAGGRHGGRRPVALARRAGSDLAIGAAVCRRRGAGDMAVRAP